MDINSQNLAITHSKIDLILQARERKYNNLIKRSGNPIYILKNRRAQLVNPAWENLFGYSRNEALSTNFDFYTTIAPECRKVIAYKLDKIISDPNPNCIYKFKALTKQGKKVFIEASIRTITWQGESAFQCIYNAILNNQKAIENQVRIQDNVILTQNYARNNQSTRNMLHDFYNILAEIHKIPTKNEIESISNGSSSIYNKLDQIIEVYNRETNLTSQLLQLNTKKDIKYCSLDLDKIIADQLADLRKILGNRININLELDKNLLPIYGNQSEIEKVLVNLAANAKDAMKNFGELTIRTKNLLITDSKITKIHQTSPGYYVCFEMKDTGTGIKKTWLDKIFTPFFTSKPAKHGMGLGLPIVQGIIRNHKGWIEVDSEPGFGAIFKIFLPAF